MSTVAAAPPRNWFQRNWKWLIPVGCLGLLLVPVGCVVGIAAITFGALKSSDVYQQSLERAKANPQVIEALGEPIDAGLLMSGSINVSGPSGEADVAIPIHGPNGKGTIYAVATKSAGTWTYSRLEVEIDGRAERIQLPRE